MKPQFPQPQSSIFLSIEYCVHLSIVHRQTQTEAPGVAQHCSPQPSLVFQRVGSVACVLAALRFPSASARRCVNGSTYRIMMFGEAAGHVDLFTSAASGLMQDEKREK